MTEGWFPASVIRNSTIIIIVLLFFSCLVCLVAFKRKKKKYKKGTERGLIQSAKPSFILIKNSKKVSLPEPFQMLPLDSETVPKNLRQMEYLQVFQRICRYYHEDLEIHMLNIYLATIFAPSTDACSLTILTASSGSCK